MDKKPGITIQGLVSNCTANIRGVVRHRPSAFRADLQGGVHGLETLAGARVQAVAEQRDEQPAEGFLLMEHHTPRALGLDAETVLAVEQAGYQQSAEPA